MAAREACDRIDVRALEGLGELVGVELCPDAGDEFAGMEVQVYLAVWQVEHEWSPLWHVAWGNCVQS